MKYVVRNCNYCGNLYNAEQRYLNRNEGIYCSQSCAGKAAGERLRKPKIPNVTCYFCGTELYVKPSRLKRSKSGIIFCSKEHQNLAAQQDSGVTYSHGPKPGQGFTHRNCCSYKDCTRQTKNKYCYKHEVQNKIERWLSGDISVSWSGKAKEPAGWVKKYLLEVRGDKCEVCGWDEKAPDGRSIIQMDHIDGNYLNNEPSNLKLLCPNHHAMTPTYGSLNNGNGRKHRRKNL